jgi:hypothetical protein
MHSQLYSKQSVASSPRRSERSYASNEVEKNRLQHFANVNFVSRLPLPLKFSQRHRTSPKIVAQRTGAAKFEEYYDDDNTSKESNLKKRFSQDPDIEPSDADPEIYQGVLGRPGVDFPVMTTIPKTDFDCKNLGNGYFADLETSCQVSLTDH